MRSQYRYGAGGANTPMELRKIGANNGGGASVVTNSLRKKVFAFENVTGYTADGSLYKAICTHDLYTTDYVWNIRDTTNGLNIGWEKYECTDTVLTVWLPTDALDITITIVG